MYKKVHLITKIHASILLIPFCVVIQFHIYKHEGNGSWMLGGLDSLMLKPRLSKSFLETWIIPAHLAITTQSCGRAPHPHQLHIRRWNGSPMFLGVGGFFFFLASYYTTFCLPQPFVHHHRFPHLQSSDHKMLIVEERKQNHMISSFRSVI